MGELLVAESIKRADLLRQDVAGSETAADQFAVDDQRPIRTQNSNCAKRSSQIQRQLCTG